MSNGLIQATSQGIAGTYKDGTIKVVITIEPTDASEAFAILGTPGAPLVVGQLTQEAAKAALQQSAASDGDGRQAAAAAGNEQKGGELAKWAGMLSMDGRFVHWAVEADRELWDECFRVTEPVGAYGGVAAEFIRRKCGVQSRRELDHNKQAGLIFREQIMRPYSEWKERQ